MMDQNATWAEEIVYELAYVIVRAIDKRLMEGKPGLPPNLRQQRARRRRLRRENAPKAPK